MAAGLSEIESVLARKIGLDPVSVGSPLILRAVHERMKELGLVDLAVYENRVRQSEPELQALIEAVVVSESWFFRDERPFERFCQFVAAHWARDLLRSPFRVLSLPCAGGEEPYSIAMVLHELGLPVSRFQIDAVDISAHRLALARRGVYSANAFRGRDLSFRARYFREIEQGYELDIAIRSMVHFEQASVLDEHLLEGSPPYDVVFCRNLMIYLEVPARLHLLAAIERLLKSDGLLFIGHADRLDVAGVEARFVAAGDPACFAYRPRHSGHVAPSPPITASVAASGHPTHQVIAPPPSLALIAPATMALPVGYPPAPMAEGDEQPLLDQAALLANQGRFDEAIAVCERHLRNKGFSASAYYLLGMICQAAGNRERAEECFQKTLYLEPMHDEALLALALLAERRGDLNAARGFRRRAERSLTNTRKRAD